MKKIIISIIGILILTGCSKSINTPYIYKEGYYNIAIPYKAGVSNNYVVNNMNTYDVDEVETTLMEISSLYFSKDVSFYQDGQYLSNDFFKEILNKDNLNSYEKITIDGITIDPYYVTGIVEQNYLDSSNNLKGISLGIILNPYLAYQNKYGITLYKQIEEKELLSIGEEVSKKLLEKVRSIEEISKTKIMIALYFQNNPNSNTEGSYKKYGITLNTDIEFKDYNEENYYISSEYVMKNNNDIYSYYSVLERNVKEVMPKIYLTGTCEYKNSKLENVIINISGTYLSKSETLALTQIVSENIESVNVNTIIYIKESNNIKAILEKNKTEKLNIHILEGI